MSTFGGPRLIPTVPGGSSRPNRTSSVKKSKFSKLLLKPFCQITADLELGIICNCGSVPKVIRGTFEIRNLSSVLAS